MNTENVDELVLRFQAGDQASGEELLRLFGGHPDFPEPKSFIGKYYSLLRYGKVNFDDRDTRRFIALYIKDPEIRKQLKPHYQYREAKAKAIKVLDEKVVTPLSVISDEDLLQDLRFLFLMQAKRFRKKRRKVNFAGYLYNSYRYAVKNYLEIYLKETEPFRYRNLLLRIQDDRLEDEESEIIVIDRNHQNELMIKIDDDLGHNWVRGITCGEEFKNLTPLQRMIIKLYYDEGLSDRKIADKLSMHINTIFKQRKKAQETVIQTVEELIKEGHYLYGRD